MPTQIGENRAKKMLKANELVLCMGVNQLRTPNIAMIAAACGFDAIYIDLEHNPTSLETAAGVCVAALGMGITPIARVTSHDPHDATRILDLRPQAVENAGAIAAVDGIDVLHIGASDLSTEMGIPDGWADTTTAHGRLMLTVLGGLAEFERDLIRTRTGEGRERAKARGVKLGRKPKLTEHQKRGAIRRRDHDGEAVRQIARSYNVSHSTISRLAA